ncbi:hypothetical protein PIB30_057657 [Stylosanthes scabra]|uniref:Uncharacterized protein n=1 Tax=Stylosanthes scabra TaxID=79078 RepID=A0ABU6ZIG4_9FABA|nr:hypothetical protein [Stylosanthes scabra]
MAASFHYLCSKMEDAVIAQVIRLPQNFYASNFLHTHWHMKMTAPRWTLHTWKNLRSLEALFETLPALMRRSQEDRREDSYDPAKAR